MQRRQPTLIVIDDFLSNPMAKRNEALAMDYVDYEHKGVKYHGIGKQHGPPFVHPLLDGQISEAMGFPVQQILSFFRLNLGTDEPSTYIHADSDESEFAGVLYLTLPKDCMGGTAFWAHAAHKSEAALPGVMLPPASLGLDQEAWRMKSIIGMRFNRFIAYKSNLFHSRFPKETWGTTRENGRLILATFFNRA